MHRPLTPEEVRARAAVALADGRWRTDSELAERIKTTPNVVRKALVQMVQWDLLEADRDHSVRQVGRGGCMMYRRIRDGSEN